jgi:anti-sigma factor RsiW
VLTCKQLIEALGDYLDGRLSLSRHFAVMVHLFCCGHCRSYLHDYRATIKASQASMARIDEPPAVEVPEDFVQAVLKARKDV